MDANVFYPQIVDLMALPPTERHMRFSQLHTTIVQAYLSALRAITVEKAAQKVVLGSETRTLTQVVGHIMEWERFMLLAAGDVLAGVRQPRMVTSLAGYIEPDGALPTFAGIDAFNAYQAEKHANWPWEKVRAMALDTAPTLHALFTQPHLLTAERLEQTQRHRKRLYSGAVLEEVAMGWSLWIIALEHEGVEHAPELGM